MQRTRTCKFADIRPASRLPRTRLRLTNISSNWCVIVPVLRLSLEKQLNRLDVLMGAQPGTYARELEAASEVPSIPAIPGDQQPMDVLRRRPDIIAAERRLAASNER